MATQACTEACRTPVDCVTCRKRKVPRGRSVPMEAANGYCNHKCPGYYLDPQPPHLWPDAIHIQPGDALCGGDGDGGNCDRPWSVRCEWCGSCFCETHAEAHEREDCDV